MVCKQYGEPAWESIKTARMDVEIFVSNQSSDDDISCQVVAAASKMLNAPFSTLPEAFGRHWVLHTAQEGDGSLMRAAGKSLPQFLLNLPRFHNRVAMSSPNLQPPHFACTDTTPTSLKLHYKSYRHGLSSFVGSLIRGLGKLFRTPVTIALVDARDNGAGHDLFVFTYPASPN